MTIAPQPRGLDGTPHTQSFAVRLARWRSSTRATASLPRPAATCSAVSPRSFRSSTATCPSPTSRSIAAALSVRAYVQMSILSILCSRFTAAKAGNSGSGSSSSSFFVGCGRCCRGGGDRSAVGAGARRPAALRCHTARRHGRKNVRVCRSVGRSLQLACPSRPVFDTPSHRNLPEFNSYSFGTQCVSFRSESF